MTLKVEKVGHLVLRVRDIEEALSFYCGVLGLNEVARGDFGKGPMVFLSTGNSHHDIALVDTRKAVERRGALDHFALKVGNNISDLVEAKAHLQALDAPIHTALDHGVSQSIYTTDPDGNLIELYVDDTRERWRDDPSLVNHAEPLEL